MARGIILQQIVNPGRIFIGQRLIRLLHIKQIVLIAIKKWGPEADKGVILLYGKVSVGLR